MDKHRRVRFASSTALRCITVSAQNHPPPGVADGPEKRAGMGFFVQIEANSKELPEAYDRYIEDNSLAFNKDMGR